ncbi:MAG: TetR family transcriptional regulator [Dehalococcoidia bacterium]|nr:TetR family transcriptional regulator [Dehalococcoidia bacterium]
MTQTDRGSAPVGLRGHRVRNVERTEEKKQAILLGAARAFARRGYQGTNLEDIAAEAGLAKGHLYHYFVSKEHLFTEIRVMATRNGVRGLEAIIARGLGPEATLRRAIRAQVAVSFQPVEQQAIILNDPPDLCDESRALIRDLQRQFENLIAGVIREGMESGAFTPGDPKLAAFTVTRASVSVATWYRPGGPWEPEWIADQVTEMIMRSVLAPGRGQAPAS